MAKPSDCADVALAATVPAQPSPFQMNKKVQRATLVGFFGTLQTIDKHSADAELPAPHAALSKLLVGGAEI